MKIVNEYPPNIKEIKKRFDVPRNAIFTYGDLYNPNGVEISEHLLRHEEVHAKQQGDNPEVWWERYFEDSEFRLSQELVAYRKQIKSFKASTKNREEIAQYIFRLASDLSSKMYGSIISFPEAIKIFKNI